MYGSEAVGLLSLAAAVAMALAGAAVVFDQARRAEAAAPSDPGMIAFQSRRNMPWGTNPEGDVEIFTMNPDGLGATQLTVNPANDGEPSRSGDGTEIVFVSVGDGDREIYSMNSDGGGHKRLPDDPASDDESPFSPDACLDDPKCKRQATATLAYKCIWEPDGRISGERGAPGGRPVERLHNDSRHSRQVNHHRRTGPSLCALGMIAEGIEIAGQPEPLREMGRDLVHGCYFSRPISSDALEGAARKTAPVGRPAVAGER
jgi:hypothetical protein